MAGFIEEFFYGNIDPQARSSTQNSAVQKEMQMLSDYEEETVLIFAPAVLVVTSTTSTSYTDSKATAKKKYYYRVKAVCSVSAATSAQSAAKSLTCDLARPTVKITTSKGDPKLSWAKVTGATKYEVYRATSKSGTYSKMTTTSKTSYTNTSAKAGKTYYYKVKAVCGTSAAASAYSMVVSIKAK